MYEVFLHLDSKKLGRIGQEDFDDFCMDFGIVKNPVSDIKLFQKNYLWTSGQRPYWELWKRKQVKSLNFDEFKISVLGCWARLYDFSQQRHSITYDNSSGIETKKLARKHQGCNHKGSLDVPFTDPNTSYRSSKLMPTINYTYKKVRTGKNSRADQNIDRNFSQCKKIVSKKNLSKYKPKSMIRANSQQIENGEDVNKRTQKIGNKKNLKGFHLSSKSDENITTLR